MKLFEDKTTSNRKDKRDTSLLLPVAGMLLFVLLYVLATLLYPGGSQHDKMAKGFSWLHNYWCNLLNTTAINGDYNPARSVALAAMLVLCLSLALFWYQFPRHMPFTKKSRIVIQVSGIVSMTIALFLFTPYHDAIINVAGICAVAALSGTLAGIYKNGWRLLLFFGIWNLLLVGINNYVYYSATLLYCLPVVQKITFASFLIWIGCICVQLFQRQHQPAR